MRRQIILGLALFIPHFLLSQSPGRMKKLMDSVARSQHTGVLAVQVDSSLVTVNTSAFVGLKEIPLTGDIAALINSTELRSGEGEAATIRLAQMLVDKGVKFRKAGDNKKALLCYRLPLYAVGSAMDGDGMRIVSNNAWYAFADIRAIAASYDRDKTIDQQSFDQLAALLKADALNILQKNEEQFKSQVSANTNVFLFYERMLGFADRQRDRRNLIFQYLENTNSTIAGCFFSISEFLDDLDTEEILLPATTSKNGPAAIDSIWAYYGSIRPYISKATDLELLSSYMELALRNFEKVRTIAVTAGGSTGIKVSYYLSTYLQIIGSDLVYLNYLSKNDLAGIKNYERIRSRSLTDWIARSHPNHRLKLTLATGSMGETEPATVQEIADLAYAWQSPILMYQQVANGYIAWMMRPDYKYLTSPLIQADSLIDKLYHLLPYGPLKSESGTPTLGGRGAGTTSTVEGTSKEQLLKTLYAKLIPPVFEKYLADSAIKNLMIITDGKLNFFPFSSLKDKNGKYLVESMEINYWPSVSSAMILAQGKEILQIQDKKEMRIIANPVFNGKYLTTINGREREVSLSGLPGTEKEAVTIGKLFGVTPIVGKEANTALFNDRQRFNVFHIATHGLLNAEKPFRSFIALSDGPLYAERLYENDGLIKANLVVLSACQTALGSDNADSPISLTNAFLVGGANMVISSLWTIDDEATSEFMTIFFTELKKGVRPATALRTAQLKLMRNPKTEDPFYWAAFRSLGLDENPFK